MNRRKGSCLRSVVLISLLLVVGWPAPAAALTATTGRPVSLAGRLPTQQAEPPAIDVSVTPDSAPLDGVRPLPVTVAIANSNGEAITDLSVAVDPPPGVEWAADEPSASNLAPGDRILVRGELRGRARTAASTRVEVAGEVGGRIAFAAVVVPHPPAPSLASLALSGETQLTNDDDLIITARVTNTGDTAIEVQLSAETTDDRDRIDAPTLDPETLAIEPGGSEVSTLTIGGDRLPTGNEVATVIAEVTSGRTSEQLVATHTFETTAFGDENLIGTLGFASLLLLPGFGAFGTWGLVRSRWRRQRGVESDWVPDLKNIGALVVVVVLSAAAIAGYDRLRGDDLYDGYSWQSLLTATAAASAATLVAALLRWGWINLRYPVLHADTRADAVFWKLPRWALAGGTIDDKTGRVLWVHDGSACITAGIAVTSTDPKVTEAVNGGRLWRLKWLAWRHEDQLSISWRPRDGEIDKGGITAPIPAGFRTTGVQPVIRQVGEIPHGRAPRDTTGEAHR